MTLVIGSTPSDPRVPSHCAPPSPLDQRTTDPQVLQLGIRGLDRTRELAPHLHDLGSSREQVVMDVRQVTLELCAPPRDECVRLQEVRDALAFPTRCLHWLASIESVSLDDGHPVPVSRQEQCGAQAGHSAPEDRYCRWRTRESTDVTTERAWPVQSPRRRRRRSRGGQARPASHFHRICQRGQDAVTQPAAFRDAARNARQRETDGTILGLEKSLLSTTRSALVTGSTSAR